MSDDAAPPTATRERDEPPPSPPRDATLGSDTAVVAAPTPQVRRLLEETKRHLLAVLKMTNGKEAMCAVTVPDAARDARVRACFATPEATALLTALALALLRPGGMRPGGGAVEELCEWGPPRRPCPDGARHVFRRCAFRTSSACRRRLRCAYRALRARARAALCAHTSRPALLSKA
jgi:hypothetical protein